MSTNLTCSTVLNVLDYCLFQLRIHNYSLSRAQGSCTLMYHFFWSNVHLHPFVHKNDVYYYDPLIMYQGKLENYIIKNSSHRRIGVVSALGPETWNCATFHRWNAPSFSFPMTSQLEWVVLEGMSELAAFLVLCAN